MWERNCKFHRAHVAGGYLVLVKDDDKLALGVKIEILLAGQAGEIPFRRFAVQKIGDTGIGGHLAAHLLFDIFAYGLFHFGVISQDVVQTENLAGFPVNSKDFHILGAARHHHGGVDADGKILVRIRHHLIGGI